MGCVKSVSVSVVRYIPNCNNIAFAGCPFYTNDAKMVHLVARPTAKNSFCGEQWPKFAKKVYLCGAKVFFHITNV